MAETAPVLPMRRLGSNAIHLVAIRIEDLPTLKWIGPAFLGTTAPVVSMCGATLNSTKAWMRNGTPCRRCQRIADHHGHPIEFFPGDNGQHITPSSVQQNGREASRP